MKLDASAMMGYTGAVLSKFLGKGWGSLLIAFSLVSWIIVPLFYLRRLENKKDF
jgi:Cu-processing system permease protein